MIHIDRSIVLGDGKQVKIEGTINEQELNWLLNYAFDTLISIGALAISKSTGKEQQNPIETVSISSTDPDIN